jgi:hypothetical protein
MAPTPEDQKPQFLSQAAILSKFNELNMLDSLKHTCFIRPIKPLKVTTRTRTPVTTSLSVAQQKKWEKKWGWRGESFIRTGNNVCMAIIHWRENLVDQVQMKVEQFEAPDGTWYVIDTVKHPQRGISSESE